MQQHLRDTIADLRMLTLSQKMGIIDQYNVNVNVAAVVFGISPGTIASAKADIAMGMFLAEQCDPDKYREVFEYFKGKYPRLPKFHQSKSSTSDNVNNSTVQFFNDITEERQKLMPLLEKHGVSINTARQYKRFDPYSDTKGKVKIRNKMTDSGVKEFFIWREPVEKE